MKDTLATLQTQTLRTMARTLARRMPEYAEQQLGVLHDDAAEQLAAIKEVLATR